VDGTAPTPNLESGGMGGDGTAPTPNLESGGMGGDGNNKIQIQNKK
jgi:hypothetical protein